MKNETVPATMTKFVDDALEMSKAKKTKWVAPGQVRALFVLGHDARLSISGHFYTYGVEGTPLSGLLSRNDIAGLIRKGLAFKSTERGALPEITDKGRELFSAVTGYDATRSLDTPFDETPQKEKARTFTDMHDDHKFRFLTALTLVLRQHPGAELKPGSQVAGVFMIPAKDRDYDTGKVISSFSYDVRVYYNAVNYRVLKSSYLPAAALASDVCRVAFYALKSTRRQTKIPHEDGFNFPIALVRAALDDEKVQVCLRAILKEMEPGFSELVTTYPPAPIAAKPGYDELEAKVVELEAGNARLTKLLAAANVTTWT